MSWKSIARASVGPIAFALAGGLLGGTQALAAQEPDARSVAVRYQDLDLSTLFGANSLYQRIRGAARVACGEPGYDLHSKSLYRDCYADAVADAVAAVNNPNLTAVHRGHVNATAMLERPRN